MIAAQIAWVASKPSMTATAVHMLRTSQDQIEPPRSTMFPVLYVLGCGICINKAMLMLLCLLQERKA
jgi:hypothetical protein